LLCLYKTLVLNTCIPYYLSYTRFPPTPHPRNLNFNVSIHLYSYLFQLLSDSKVVMLTFSSDRDRYLAPKIASIHISHRTPTIPVFSITLIYTPYAGQIFYSWPKVLLCQTQFLVISLPFAIWKYYFVIILVKGITHICYTIKYLLW
jgi:hypothetical protein